MAARPSLMGKTVRRLAALALAVVLSVTGCQVGDPHACDNHGGVRVYVKAIYYCNDGTKVGNGWLWLHHKKVAP